MHDTSEDDEIDNYGSENESSLKNEERMEAALFDLNLKSFRNRLKRREIKKR